MSILEIFENIFKNKPQSHTESNEIQTYVSLDEMPGCL